VGRTYAGILGPLAMVVVVTRGVVASASVEGTLSVAMTHLVVFAIVGLVVGSIAQSTVDTAVRTKLEKHLETELVGDL
jgi:hypothetical protein